MIANGYVLSWILCFFRLSNLVPHAIGEFDPSHNFAGGDVLFGKPEARLALKWSKTMQTRDQVKVITRPHLDMAICSYGALKGSFHCYNPGSMEPLFQIKVSHSFQVVTDSRVRKVLAMLNQAMGLHMSSIVPLSLIFSSYITLYPKGIYYLYGVLRHFQHTSRKGGFVGRGNWYKNCSRFCKLSTIGEKLPQRLEARVLLPLCPLKVSNKLKIHFSRLLTTL